MTMAAGQTRAANARIRSHAVSRDATAIRGVIRIAIAARVARHDKMGSGRINNDVRNNSSASVLRSNSLRVTRASNPRH